MQVTYTTEALAMTDRKTREGMKLMGLDPASAKCRAKCLAGAASHGPEARAVCERGTSPQHRSGLIGWGQFTNTIKV